MPDNVTDAEITELLTAKAVVDAEDSTQLTDAWVNYSKLSWDLAPRVATELRSLKESCVQIHKEACRAFEREKCNPYLAPETLHLLCCLRDDREATSMAAAARQEVKLLREDNVALVKQFNDLLQRCEITYRERGERINELNAANELLRQENAAMLRQFNDMDCRFEIKYRERGERINALVDANTLLCNRLAELEQPSKGG